MNISIRFMPLWSGWYKIVVHTWKCSFTLFCAIFCHGRNSLHHRKLYLLSILVVTFRPKNSQSKSGKKNNFKNKMHKVRVDYAEKRLKIMIDQIKSIFHRKRSPKWDENINSNKNSAFKFNSQLFQMFNENFDWDQNWEKNATQIYTLQ